MGLLHQKLGSLLSTNTIRQNLLITGFLAITSVFITYCLLLLTYHGPLNAFWSSDHGVKLFQIQSLTINKFQSNALIYPGASIDIEQRFTPFRGQYLVHDGQTYGMFSQIFAIISAIPFFLFGYPGLYLIPLVSSVGMLIVFAILSRSLLHPIAIVLGIFCLGLASPLVFYATNFWEHTPAAFILLLGIFFSVIAFSKKNLWYAVLAGAMIALATYLRNEIILFAPAIVISLLVVQKLSAFRYILAFSLGTILFLLPLLLFNQYTYGTFLGAHISVAGEGARLSILEWAGMLIVPITPVTIPLILSAMIIVSLLGRWLHKQHLAQLAIPALIILLIIQCTASLDSIGLTSLITAFPFVLLIFIPAPKAHSEQGNQQERRITYIQLVAMIVVGLCWVVRLPDGGAQHGPRMLLPTMPLFLIVGIWNVEQWFRYRKGTTNIITIVITITIIIHAALIAQADGLKNYQYVVSRNHDILTTVAQSGEHVIITDTVYTPLLIAPLMYDDRLIFMVETGNDLDDLINKLKQHDIHQFYYLGVLPPDITEASTYWRSLQPITERAAFAHRLRGQAFRVRSGN
jgi:hypothetical protein